MVGNLSHFGGKRAHPFGRKAPSESSTVQADTAALKADAKRVLKKSKAVNAKSDSDAAKLPPKQSKSERKRESLNFSKVIFDAIAPEIDLSYVGFNKLSSSLKAKGASNPDALAAWIGRRKYSKKKFQKAATAGVSLRPKKKH